MGKGVKLSKAEMEKLIDLVRRNKCLYKPDSAEYHDQQKITNVWASIAVIMKRDDIDGNK